MRTASVSVMQGIARGRRWILTGVSIPAAVLATSWYFTAPAELRPNSPKLEAQAPRLGQLPAPSSFRERSQDEKVAESSDQAFTWPETTLEGEPAKRLLLDILLADQQRLDRVPGYTATFRKRERMRGRLNPEQTLEIKIRHEPLAIYMKFLAPKEGREVIFAQGFNDDCVIGHNGDWTRRLIPRLKARPTDTIALLENRHPITEAGLANLTRKLVGFRKLDLADPEAVTILDWYTDEENRRWPRSVHIHPIFHPERPFARTEILYDPNTLLPRRFTGYDWPGPGQDSELLLGEQYTYDDVNFDVNLTDRDFDPANPAYAFTRY